MNTNITSIEEISKLLSANQYQNAEESDSFPFDGAEITMTFLANHIEKKIKQEVKSNCIKCVTMMSTIFLENQRWNSSDNSSNTIPCQSTVEIGLVCNHLLRVHSFKIEFNYAALILLIEEENEIFEMS